MSADGLIHFAGNRCSSASKVAEEHPGKLGAVQCSSDDMEVTCPDCRRLNGWALQTLTDGTQVYPGHAELKANGQQKDYVVLSESERARGFVRPVRDTYKHVGRRPVFEVRPLTDEEKARHGDTDWEAFEPYPPGYRGSAAGQYWSKADLKSGCAQTTTMGAALAETYARDPKFYGATFCVGCGKHFPVGERGEFVWVERDGRPGPRVGT